MTSLPLSLSLRDRRSLLPLCLVRATGLTITRLTLSFCVTASFLGGAGIFTCYPSATTSVLTLGPDLPWADEPSPGNLGLSTAMFLAWLSLLIPALSLLYGPPLLSVWLLPVHNAPLPLPVTIPMLAPALPLKTLHTPFQQHRKHTDCNRESAASVARFSPGHLRRTTTRPVSYYALFKCMAASKPTSWLSVQFHILLHLTCTWGP